MPKITDAYYESSTNGTGYIIGYQDGVFCRWPIALLEGTPGNQITVSAINPVDADGLNGDVHINNSTWDFFQKVNGTWGASLGVIKGINGTNGTNGVGVPSGGTTGQVLVKNSGTDYDTGWVAQSGGSGSVNFSANKNGTDQTGISQNTYTKLTFTNELWDTGNCYDATNSKFIPQTAGKYQIIAGLAFNSGTSTDIFAIAIYKNGTKVKDYRTRMVYTSNEDITISVLLDMNGTTDYVEVYGYHNFSGTRDVSGNTVCTYFQATIIP